MMTVTDIFLKKGTRFQVEIDGEYFAILDAEILSDFHLKKGQPITETEKAEILRAAEYRKGRERALYLLEYRDHCRKELIDKLLKSVSGEVAEEIADRMEELGLLSDERYAQKFARHLLCTKKYGERRALQEMMRKGLSAELSRDAIAKEKPSENLLQTLVEQKYRRYLGDEKGKNKVIAALLRRGFDYHDILEAIDEEYASLEE